MQAYGPFSISLIITIAYLRLDYDVELYKIEDFCYNILKKIGHK